MGKDTETKEKESKLQQIEDEAMGSEQNKAQLKYSDILSILFWYSTGSLRDNGAVYRDTLKSCKDIVKQ